MKRIIALLLAALLLLSLCACTHTIEPTDVTPTDPSVSDPTPSADDPTDIPTEPQPETREFTDSLGRTVTLPTKLDKVAISGPLAQIFCFALCPDKLVGIATAWDKTAEAFFDTSYYNLPILGQLYGGKGELNLETLLASGAQVVIDVGEPKKTAKDDLDALQEQTGIVFVHITATTETAADAYRKLGDLVGMTEEAEVLAKYCEQTYANITELMSKVTKKRVLYCLGDKGCNVIAKGSFHGEILDMMAENVAVVDSPSSKGTGNEVDMEQILLWNPDVILFAPGSIYGTVTSDSAWTELDAIKNDNFYEVPFGPYNWMGFPPSVQRYLGMLWLAKLLYPEQADFKLFTEVQNYFKLFYHCELTQAQFEDLMKNSK